MTSTNISSHLIFLGLTLTLVGIASATTYTTTITKTTYTTLPANGNTDASPTTETTTYTSPPTETTDASPTIENTDASSTTENTTYASPTTENTDASPTTENTDASPTTENTDASPTTENTTYASPTTENTDASPTTENSYASPTTENSYGSPMTKSTPKEYLAAHNKVRAEAYVEPLTWNETLVAYAQKYANTRIATCDMVHSEGPYGENLAMGYEEMTAEKAVRLWADEKKFYTYKTNTCGDDPNHCLHYTQVVWKDTKSVGCAQVKCENKWVFLICNYYPPGNVIGQSPY